MKKIPLTRGKFAIVDDEDYNWLSQWKWMATHPRKQTEDFYATRNVFTKNGVKKIYMHREILSPPPGYETDHINRKKNDNRRENLRLATRHQNEGNKAKRRGTTSVFKGVRWHKGNRSWCAAISMRFNGKSRSITIGNFKKEEDAAKAYDKAALDYFREFAWLNFPDEV